MNHCAGQIASIFTVVCGCFPYIAASTDMEEFIKEYLTEANKEIELFNRQLELQRQPDLFDP